MATLYRQPESANWYISYSLDGVRVRRSLNTASESIARKRLAEIERQVKSSTVAIGQRCRIDEAVERFLISWADRKVSTRRHYTSKLGTFAAWAGNVYLDTIHPETMERYRLHRRESHAAGTVKTDLVAIGTWLTWCVDHGHIATTPLTRQIKRVSGVHRDKPIALTELQIVHYRLALRGSIWYPVLMFGVYAGLRRAELALLERRDISDGWIHLRNKPKLGLELKNCECRDVPVDVRLAPLVRSLPAGPVCPAIAGGHWSPDALSKAWPVALSAVQLEPRVTMHGLRHTYAMRQVTRGCNVRNLMIWMGHSSILTTQGYFDDRRRL